MSTELGSRSVRGRGEGWSVEHSMQRKLCEKIEGGVKENGMFGKLQTIPYGRIAEFKGWGDMVRNLPREVSRNCIFEGFEYLRLESVVVVIHFQTWNVCTLRSPSLFQISACLLAFCLPSYLVSKILGLLHSSGSSIQPHSLHQHFTPSACYA